MPSVQEAADKLAAYAGYSGKRAAQDSASPDAWDVEEAPASEVELVKTPLVEGWSDDVIASGCNKPRSFRGHRTSAFQWDDCWIERSQYRADACGMQDPPRSWDAASDARGGSISDTPTGGISGGRIQHLFLPSTGPDFRQFLLQDAPESWEADDNAHGSGIGGSALRGGAQQAAYSDRTMQSLEVRHCIQEGICDTQRNW